MAATAAAAALLSGALGACDLAEPDNPPTRSTATAPSLAGAAVPLPNKGRLRVSYPAQGAHFPADIIPPTILWKDETGAVGRWRVSIVVGGAALAQGETDKPQWRPPADTWRRIQRQAAGSSARLTVEGHGATTDSVRSRANVQFVLSSHAVGAPILYRDVLVPFGVALKRLPEIRWRLGWVDTFERPAVVLEDLPVCANCHSVSRNGKYLGMNVDLRSHRGNFTISPIRKETPIDDETTMSFAGYRPDDPQYRTTAFLHTFSPDGRYVVTTGDDRSSVVHGSDIEYSFSAFFTYQGVLVVYDTQTKKFWRLPGADDPAYVQTNAEFSPDGKTLVFARAKALDVPDPPGEPRALNPSRDVVMKAVEARGGFQYDLYRIPFNDGKGGEARPIEGAANNGKSNYFPKISPNGKWLVFTQAKGFNLLQPDSRLFIVPLAGGKPREMTCNTPNMNSWHSWSPNGQWLVFSSKARPPYTKFFLTHVDEQGNDTPPVLLENFVIPKRSANIPEFANIPRGKLERIVQTKYPHDKDKPEGERPQPHAPSP